MQASRKLLICLGIGVVLGGFIAYWRYASAPPTQPVDLVDSQAATEQAQSGGSPASLPPSRSSGVMDQSATPWRLERPAVNARGSSAVPRRAAHTMEAACQQAVGRWQVSPASEIVLEPFGKVSRVHADGLAADPESSWSCTQAQDIQLDLTEGRFTGQVNDAGQLEVSDLAGRSIVWPRGGSSDDS